MKQLAIVELVCIGLLSLFLMAGCMVEEPSYKLEVPRQDLSNGISQVALYSKKGDSNYYIMTGSSNYVRTQWAITNR